MGESIAATRFWRKVDRKSATKCWPWKQRLNKFGYGEAMINGVRTTAHRWAYIFANGGIPDQLVIDHICRNRSCVNPAHLRAVTVRQNVLENSVGRAALNAQKTRCNAGHELIPVNLTSTGIAKGHRVCRICKARYLREWRLRNKQS